MSSDDFVPGSDRRSIFTYILKQKF